MLKKFTNASPKNSFHSGDPVYLVTRKGKIIDGYYIQDILMDLVSLNRSPLDGTEKQGFTIEGNLLRPNWCAGKVIFEAACLSRNQAEKIAEEVIKQNKEGKTQSIQTCTNRKKSKASS